MLLLLALLLTLFDLVEAKPTTPLNTINYNPELLTEQSPYHTSIVNQVTGAAAVTSTKPVDVWGCDLGIFFKHNDTLYMAFGDTFGFGSTTTEKVNWRSNTIAEAKLRTSEYLNDPEKAGSDRIVLELAAVNWLTNRTTGDARQLIHGAHDTTYQSEVTCIPTTAMSNGSHVFVWYMSVVKFDGDTWQCNNGSIAAAFDGSPTVNLNTAEFIKQDSRVFWSGDSNFLMFAHVKHNTTILPPGMQHGYEYLCATRCGREGAVYLLRVPKNKILTQSYYEYFVGSPGSTCRNASWSKNMTEAAPIFPPHVGELSVTWVPGLERFVALFTSPLSKIQVATSSCLFTGWSNGSVVVDPSVVGGDLPYGGFSHTDLIANDGIYFTTSQWNHYEVYLTFLNFDRFR